MILCGFSDIFGKPGEGIHSYRMFGVAAVDVALAVAAALIIAQRYQLPRWVALAAVFATGVVAHRIFCVKTAVDTWLFPK